MSLRPRSRRVLLALLAATIGLGLASRRFAGHLPALVASYAGDVLWAVMVYWLLALVVVRARPVCLGAGALGVAVLVEVSQLIHTPGLDMLRQNPFGALVLGQGFLWSDLACYAVGAMGAVLLDRALHITGTD